MNVSEAAKAFRAIAEATEPEKLPSLTPVELYEHRNALIGLRRLVAVSGLDAALCEQRIHLLQLEIDSRQAEDRHEQNQSLGRKTLFWARWAVLAAVAVPIVIVLLQDTRISSFLRARPSRASPASSPTPTATVAASATPTVTESPSESPQASATP